MYPILRLISSDWVATSKPATIALPEVGLRRPHRIRIVVDLPAPFGPRKPKISPRFTSSETLSTATKSPNRLVRRSRWTAGPFALGCTSHLLFPRQHDENIFQRGRDGVVSEWYNLRQLLRGSDFRIYKQVQIGARRLHRKHAGLFFENLPHFALVRSRDQVNSFLQAALQRRGSVALDQAPVMHESDAIGSLHRARD